MTVRYSRLAPDFMADGVERLVPRSETTQQTDTRTDTARRDPADAEIGNVH